jgi:hypothetical protein
MNPPDKIDEIIQDVAIRHGYVINRDDPILMTYTINQKVMESSMGIQRAVLEQHLRGMEEISKDLQDRAADQLDKVLRDAMENSRLTMRQEAENLFSRQRRENEAVYRLLTENCLQRCRFTAAMSMSIFTLLAAVIVLSATG